MDDLRLARRLVSAGGLGGIGDIFSIVVGFANNFVLVRALGTQGYGVYALALSLMAIPTTLARAGLDVGTMRFVGIFDSRGDHRKSGAVVRLSSQCALMLGALIASVIFLSAKRLASDVFAEPALEVPLRIVSLSVPINAVLYVWLYALQGTGLVHRRIQIEGFVIPSVQMTLYLLVYAVGLSVVEATVAYLVAMTVAASMALALLIRKWESVGKASLSRSERRRLFAFSGPLIVNRVLYGSVNSWIPGLIGIFLTASDVAVFEIVLRLRRIAKLPARAIGQAFSPEIPRLIDKEDMAKCENLLYVSQRWILTTTLAIQALFVIAGRELLAVFGEDFTAGYLALTMIGLATVVEGSFDPAGSIILMSGHSLLASLISLVSISITVLGTILLVPQYGILGASLAAAGAAVVVAVMCIMSVYKYHRLKALHLDLLRPVFAGVMAGSACWLIFRNFPIASDILKSILFFSAWLLTYLVGLLLFGLKKYEKQLLQEFSIWFRQKVDRSIEL